MDDLTSITNKHFNTHINDIFILLSHNKRRLLHPQPQCLTSVCQVSDVVDLKPIGLQHLGNTCYLNSVLQCHFTIDYYTSFLPANSASPLIKILQKFTESKKRV